jgi:hypothetical protein
MCKRIGIALAVLVALSVCSEASAQYAGGIYRGGSNPYNPKPTVSPYLNLLQNNNGNGLNLPQYQTLVRPFLDQQAFNNQSSADAQRLNRQVNALQSQTSNAAPGRATGHGTRFMNYSHYYGLGR